MRCAFDNEGLILKDTVNIGYGRRKQIPTSLPDWERCLWSRLFGQKQGNQKVRLLCFILCTLLIFRSLSTKNGSLMSLFDFTLHVFMNLKLIPEHEYFSK